MLLSENQNYIIQHDDCIPHMQIEMPDDSVDFSVFSPPFPSVFAYTDLPSDIGNSEDLHSETRLHFSWFFRSILRVIKPGRAMVVHCTQIARLKRSGEEGLYDFRGLLIRLGVRAGFTYEYDWLVRQNPQAQALRTKKWELKFQGLETDRAKSRGALCDYLIKFRKPGENAVPVKNPNEVTRNDWIRWAEGFWTDIRMTDTLNAKAAKGEGDTKHICPLPLPISERLIRLYTNPDEIVFSPFAGIGSEIVSAIKLGRRGYGIELKPEYHAEAIANCKQATKEAADANNTLFTKIVNEPGLETQPPSAVETDFI